MKNKQTIGIIAHVDAGKTTLAEALLYTTGKIKKIGRVDRKDSYFDSHELERERGITIFSKQAVIETERMSVTLLDTPGHVDFSAETERTLAVLDYAVLVISGSEGIQAHTETLWRLLRRYRVPTFIFVTKTDLAGFSKPDIMNGLCRNLSDGCIDFSERYELYERISMTDENALEKLMEHGSLSDDDIGELIADEVLFPCFFGSGLRLEGISEFIDALERYTVPKEYPAELSARVYKIGHDKSGAKLTYMKITGGSLTVRQGIKYYAPTFSAENDGELEEKITAIRIYSGEKFSTIDVAEAGTVCAVTGLSQTFAGQCIGAESSEWQPCLEPVLNYRMELPADVDARTLIVKLRMLEEEEPLLHILWNERYSEIHVQIMGEVQTEVLRGLIASKFGVDVSFCDGRIIYKETVSEPVEGVGHFEPLRHYAEAHILIEPLPSGSGIEYGTVCSEDFLERSWQRLILTHLEEKQHLGVLTGSPLTDVRLTLVSGRAHLKHTQGGDFRESTYRAVRQGLMTSASRKCAVLLEPYYSFRLELPCECVGRAISDILAKSGTFDEHEAGMDSSVLVGRAPVSEIGDYSREVAAYTHGKGKFNCSVEGYFLCHNTDEVIAQLGYDPTSDLDNTPDSVFCSHGAGFVVPWDRVPEYMHLEGIKTIRESDTVEENEPQVIRKNLNIDERELEAIMEREFGPIRRKTYGDPKIPAIVAQKRYDNKRSLYIIDGYNLIFAWDVLAEKAKYDLEHARITLCDILANYKGFTGRDIVLVFDAYNVKGSVERKLDYNGVNVVYTKEGELGDIYIEKLVRDIGRDYSVRVVTSDGLIQLGALRSGVLRTSAREFIAEVMSTDAEIKKIIEKSCAK